MRYEFNLDDYWDILDVISEKEYDFKQIKIDEREGSELYVYGYRIVIPELNMTIREGLNYYKDSDDEEQPEDSVVLYEGDEKDPLKYTESYCNTYLPSIIGMIAKDKGLNENPKCFIDESEFELWES